MADIQVTQVGKHTQVYAESVNAIVEAIQQPAVCVVNDSRRKGHLIGGYDSFSYGLPENVKTFPQLVRFLADGWADGAARIQQAIGDVPVPVMRSVRRRGRWADAGDEVNMDRYYAGQFETMWRTTTRQQVTSPTRVRIIADIGALGSVSASRLFWRGAAAAALNDALQEAGYATQVEAGSHAYRCNAWGTDETRTIGFQVVVKPWSAPMSLAGVASVIASAGFFRGCIFAARARFLPVQFAPGAGHSRELVPAHFVPEPGAVTVVVPQAVLSAEAARAWVAQQVAALEAGTAGVA